MLTLDSARARGIAEAMWGRGNTSAVRTNRKGAYYFSCAGHGGFVIDREAFTQAERDKIDRYGEPERAVAYVLDGKVCAYAHPYRRKSSKVSAHATQVSTGFYVFEEDCSWCLPVKFAGITTAQHIIPHAENTFWHWYDEKNPAVVERKRVAALREAGDPDLITSALAQKGYTKVWCADDRSYFVDGYDDCRDDFGNPWLSRCTNVRVAV